jgi:hypothetical protein
LHSVNQYVLDADLYEDEDWQPLSRPSLQCELTDDDILIPLERLLSELVDDELGGLLKALLLYRRDMYILQSSLAKSVRELCRIRPANSSSDISQSAMLDISTRIVSYSKSILMRLDDLQLALSHLSKGPESSNGIGLDISEMDSFADHPDITFAFSNILVRLYQNNIVRQFKILKFSDAIKYIKKVSEQIVAVGTVGSELNSSYQTNNIGEVVNSKFNIDALLYTAIEFSYSRFSLLARSFFWASIQVCRGNIPNLLKNSMYFRGVPISVLTCEAVLQWFHEDGALVRGNSILLEGINIINDHISSLFFSSTLFFTSM